MISSLEDEMHQLQRELLALIKKENLGNRTLRKIGEMLGDDVHPQAVKFHLTQLEKKGLIQIDKINGIIRKMPAGPVEGSSFFSLPIVGRANCGTATMIAQENVEGYLKVSNALLKKTDGIFCIRAVGNSMNRANVNGKTIDDGDYIIVDSNDCQPNSGDLVVSVIDGMANVKEFRRDRQNDCIVLMSRSSQDHDPIFIDSSDEASYYIAGKVIQVIKKPNVD